ncbi:MAG TPA: hypothetical protein VES42_15430, partial [Pilimelia sp.]|nr:hypothetical protein [Pilimelia sp.]
PARSPAASAAPAAALAVPAGPGAPGAPVGGAVRADGVGAVRPAEPGAPHGHAPARPLTAGVTAIRGARSELRKQLRKQKRLRMATLIVASLLLLGALPLYFGIRAATRDPVFNALDSLAVPTWAAGRTEDEISGSRWCILDCRFRERRAESERSPAETAKAYEQSLVASGWQPWKVAMCPDQPVEHYTCWRRDEYTLDLWVREPECANDALRNRPTVAPVEPGQASALADLCAGSVVSIKVRNAIADDRGKPQPAQNPDFTGEDPDPLFTEDPLQESSPTPS